MKVLFCLLVAIVCLLVGVAADGNVFWLFEVTRIEPGGVADSKNTYMFFNDGDVSGDGQPTCAAAVANQNVLPGQNDVSGNKRGLRLNGAALDPDIVEWNSGDHAIGHYTVYKDRNHHLYNLQDQDVGTCSVDTSRSFGMPNGCLMKWGIKFKGQSVFRCPSAAVSIKPVG